MHLSPKPQLYALITWLQLKPERLLLIEDIDQKPSHPGSCTYQLIETQRQFSKLIDTHINAIDQERDQVPGLAWRVDMDWSTWSTWSNRPDISSAKYLSCFVGTTCQGCRNAKVELSRLPIGQIGLATSSWAYQLIAAERWFWTAL